MAKTIKFNLIMDENPVRNIEGLQDNFSIEDILKYYNNGLLLRWLNVRGYEKEYEKVISIDKLANKKTIIKKLIEIFDISDLEDCDIDKAIAIIDYKEAEEKALTRYKKDAFEKKKIISDYHFGYDAIITHMVENKDNMAVLKADAVQMEKEYSGLFNLDFEKLYYRLVKSAPKAIFAFLTKEAFRKYWLDEQADIYKHMKYEVLAPNKALEILGSDAKIVMRDTQAMWDPIERKETRIMVISIENGTFVKNADKFNEKMSYTDVNFKLPLLDGLDYQCNDEYYKLIYMEV